MSLLQAQFDDIDRVAKEIHDIMNSIQEVNLENSAGADQKEENAEKPEETGGSLIDSFQWM